MDRLNAIPFVDPKVGVFVFAIASILKDGVNRIGDLLDDGKATASPVLGVITSFQEQIEWHLRILSLLVGLAAGDIGLATLPKSAVDAIVATAVPTQYLTE